MPDKQLSKKQKEHIERHITKRVSKHLVSKTDLIGSQFKQHVSTAIIAAFSFLIALAWKDLIVHAVQTVIKEDLVQRIPYISQLISAIVVTLIAIIGILLVTRWAKKPEILISETQTS